MLCIIFFHGAVFKRKLVENWRKIFQNSRLTWSVWLAYLISLGGFLDTGNKLLVFNLFSIQFITASFMFSCSIDSCDLLQS